ncbi:hypothetical protein SEUCBS139899_005779 [Sporothrix eucalyptigena]|uniref:Histidine acid phosphatase n=1 Tax=Sporothrix eucalyptigena TaxID=1812306 RepID=A0ABP0BNR0_9PEZI
MISPSVVLALVMAMAAPAVAEDITVWSAVVYSMYGERTPLVGPTNPALTPLGAQQLYSQGAMFRNRFILEGTGNVSVAAALPIKGIETNALDTTQLNVLSTDDSYVAAGALAFLQGLYPPQTDEFAYDNGGRTAAVLADGALVNFPLDGYQYPLIETVSLQEPLSSWIEGHLSCSEYQTSLINYQYYDEAAKLYDDTLAFYDSLWPTLFQTTFTEAATNFYNAYELYDYANYQYNHNPQTANTLNASALSDLALFAATQQLNLNANLTVSGKYSGDMVRAVAGRMLAQEVVNLLKGNMLNSGSNNKLSLLFGSFEPMISFFALSGLLGGPSASVFESLPGNGAALVFELYSMSDSDSTVGNDTVYPSPADLYVRFLYVPDSDADSELTQYGLFVTANDTTSTNMTYNEFVSAMEAIGLDSVAVWCDMCNGVSIFCPGMLENAGYGDGSGTGSGSSGDSSSDSSSSKKSGMAPAVAGVIGALVTLAVIGFVVLAAMFFGGLRFFFANKRNNNSDGSNTGNIFTKRFSFGGSNGFKGSERKMADADVDVSNAGVGHERVGSWELRGAAAAAAGGGAGAVSLTSGAGASVTSADGEPPARTERVRSTILNRTPDEDDDDIMGDLGRHPVDPREHV